MKKIKKYLVRIFKLSNIIIFIVLGLAFIFSVKPDVRFFGISAPDINLLLFSLIAIELFLNKTLVTEDIKENVELLYETIKKCDLDKGFRNGIMLAKPQELERLEDLIEYANNEICVSGITLEAIGKIQTIVRKKASEGCRVRLLALNPNGEALHASSSMSDIDYNIRKSRIHNSLNDLSLLFKNDIENGKIEMRVIDAVTPIGIVGTDINHKNGRIIAQHYLFHERSDKSPNFILSNNSDNHWYVLYKNQWDAMWKSSEVFQENKEEKPEAGISKNETMEEGINL